MKFSSLSLAMYSVALILAGGAAAGYFSFNSVMGVQHWQRVELACSDERRSLVSPEAMTNPFGACLSDLTTRSTRLPTGVRLVGSQRVSDAELIDAMGRDRLHRFTEWAVVGRDEVATMVVVRLDPIAPMLARTGNYRLDRRGALNLTESFDIAKDAFMQRQGARWLYFSAAPDASVRMPPSPVASFAAVLDVGGNPIGYVCAILDAPQSDSGLAGLARCLSLASTGRSLHATMMPSLFSYSYASDDVLLRPTWPWDIAVLGSVRAGEG